MQKKSNTIYYLIGAVILGAAGFLWYRNMKKKNEPLEPPKPLPPGPSPAPAPKPGPVGPTPASSAKIAELQNLMIKRFVQLNRAGEYDAAAAKGGWGNKSTNALKFLQPANFASRGIPNASNIDFWISSIKKDVETAAKQEKDIETKKTSDAQLKKLATDLESHLKAKKGNKIRLLADTNAIKTQFDKARGFYFPLGDTKKFFKGAKYSIDEIINRGNGTLGIKVGDFRYFVPASMFITDI